MQISQQIFVIKMAGELHRNPAVFNSLCKEIAKLKQANIKLVLVHGGGQQVTEMEEKRGNTPHIINGRRITDENSLETIKMVIAGKINIEILSSLQAHGISAVGLSGVDGHILQVCRRPPKKMINKKTQEEKIIDYGFVGEILSVNPDLLLTLLENNFLPVVAPLAADQQGIIYNINADTVATSIALALQAIQLIMLTTTDGVYDQAGNTLVRLTCKKASELIDKGIISNGMIPKIEAIISAIQLGITSVHIINGLKPERLADIFLKKSLGTLITHEEINHEYRE